MNRALPPLLLAVLAWTMASAALAFVPDDRWSRTASNRSTGSDGDPVTVTWGIVPDGTYISGEQADSSLVAFLDGIYGSAAGDVSDRPWFTYFEQAFDRWSELGGLTFVYEPADDGASLSGSSGALGVRPDVRIAGTTIDGSSGTLAYNFYPNGGDMIIDTGDTYFNNTSNNSRRLRNVLMHEAGHGFGLGHTVSTDTQMLLEPFITTAFDGPQYDDIRGLHHLYGDAYEKTNGGAGNDLYSNAINVGLIGDGETRGLGGDAGFDMEVAPHETDFISLANSSDVDFYSFMVETPSLIQLTIAPVGASFQQGDDANNQTSFVTAGISDLTLTLYDVDGTSVLAEVNETPVRAAENLLDFVLPEGGEYYFSVTGDADTVQFYEWELAVEALVTNPITLAGDYDLNGTVDARDYTVWRNSLGSTGANLAADGNLDLQVDQLDYLLWKEHFGGVLSAPVAGAAVPEPAGWVLAVVAMGMLSCTRRSGA